MKKLLPVVALLSGLIFWAACNKGDDNPYGDWKCTCFVNKMVYLPGDTVLSPFRDTVFLSVNDVDKNTAKNFCEQAKKSFTDTALIGSSASCTVK
jgi:hypothetical protein